MLSSARVLKAGQRLLSVTRLDKHTLPDLPYDFNALEPVISSEIMQLHHQKHHNAYVTNLNILDEKIHEAATKKDISALISLQPAYKFNAGGHLNHSILWKVMAKDGGEPSQGLAAAIKRDFGSMSKMQEKLSAATISVQGSGWGWLGICPESKKLRIATCANQDPLQATTGLIPLFGIDVWEHAYYLQYKNVRPDYVKAVWKVANWVEISQRFSSV
ncbi:hypothetical protein PFISCL1PPCAC_19821 [Pristionchus fissidentatus]|uniref:Superoxide dismutase n=1 Tax=Pristionchus fissidentatus TaxID=1538716 RepID=A0AAV5WFC2_9BILA|nr:hypothetical protein PFISCL1PPCAC_19821 [Pristionchus fissidentatus]